MYSAGEAAAITALLFKEIANAEKADFIRDPLKEIPEEISNKLNEALQKLLLHVPVQHIIGRVDFCGLKFEVSNAALIPRPETEELTMMLINSIPKDNPVKVLDIGTGTGCIPISIKKHFPEAKVSAIEISEYAMTLAKKNSTLLDAPIEFLQMDFLDEANWVELDKFDIMISNPPYISASENEKPDKNVLLHEPHLALFAPGNDPLIFYRKIASFALHHLQKNGVLWLELNTHLAVQTKEIFETSNFNAELLKDQFENNRFLKVTHRCR